jgi:hypothetical protein
MTLLGHWIADFVLQRNKNKTIREKKLKTKLKKLLEVLIPHSAQYSLIVSILLVPCAVVGCFNLNVLAFVYFLLLNFITHLLTDLLVTLKNSHYLSRNDRHKFFVSIGLDQFIHYATMALLINWLFF